jgi:Kef-type K+ transport system membrane component KefB/nucleotide-binding universal stress UspA family protein
VALRYPSTQREVRGHAASIGGARMIQSGAAPSVPVFIAQITALLLIGRSLGEVAHRLKQPAVIGQLLAGVVLGPSILGWWPAAEHWLFPAAPAQKAMLDGVAQLGILMLLLLTGMETNLAVVKRVKRAAVGVTVFGIALPFAGGFALGEFLPASLLPNPGARLLTALFLGIALAISSVKIVATVIKQLNFTHRKVGQVLLAAAVLDDTLGWLILAVIFGLARHGTVDFAVLWKTVLGAAGFMVLSFTIGWRAVSFVIRWTNDHLQTELAVVTVILLILGLFALATDGLGLHTALGAFVAGMLIGRSPILTAHIEGQLRGLITALFMPVFFGLAGLGTNFGQLRNGEILGWAVVVILVATVGKFGGALAGGRAGGLSWRESLAVGCGMNARGSTEVIIATLGLSMGVLSPTLFTLIVLMAIVTTLIMPSTLGAALRRVPLTAEESRRLEQREFDRGSYVAKLERLLVAVDESRSGQLASRLVGLLAGARGMPTTVLPIKHSASAASGEGGAAPAVAVAAAQAQVTEAIEAAATGSAVAIEVAAPSESSQPKEVVAVEAKKGFDLVWVGVDPIIDASGAIDSEVGELVAGFAGHAAIVSARGRLARSAAQGPLRILLTVTGTAYSRRAAEIALALAHASRSTLTALYVDPDPAAEHWRQRFTGALRVRRQGESVLKEVVDLGGHFETTVRTRIKYAADAAQAILEELKAAPYELLVMGVTPRSGEGLFFGTVPSAVLQKAPESVLLIAT